MQCPRRRHHWPHPWIQYHHVGPALQPTFRGVIRQFRFCLGLRRDLEADVIQGPWR